MGLSNAGDGAPERDGGPVGDRPGGGNADATRGVSAAAAMGLSPLAAAPGRPPEGMAPDGEATTPDGVAATGILGGPPAPPPLGAALGGGLPQGFFGSRLPFDIDAPLRALGAT